MSARSTDVPNAADLEPLVVTPREARRLLGVGNTYLYRLISTKELDSYTTGRARRIPLTSIRAYVARRLEASMGPRPKRGRGRPRKADARPEATP
jgi:excisionase family DNA binding protein